MANTFKVVTFAAEPASAGTAYKMYTCAGSTTTVVLGLILTNIHTTAVTAEVELVSDTGSRGGNNDSRKWYIIFSQGCEHSCRQFFGTVIGGAK